MQQSGAPMHVSRALSRCGESTKQPLLLAGQTPLSLGAQTPGQTVSRESLEDGMACLIIRSLSVSVPQDPTRHSLLLEAFEDR